MNDGVNMHFYQLILAPLGLYVQQQQQQRCHFLKVVTSSRIGGACVFSQPIFYLQPSFIYLFIDSPPSLPPPHTSTHFLPPPPSEKRRPSVTCVMRLMHEGTEHSTERAPHESRTHTHTHNRAAEQKPRSSSRPEGR